MVKGNNPKSYNEAKDYKQCVYVFKKYNMYIYIGKATQFGGATGRYAYGYSYLIEAMIKSGATLHVAELDDEQWENF